MDLKRVMLIYEEQYELLLPDIPDADEDALIECAGSARCDRHFIASLERTDYDITDISPAPDILSAWPDPAYPAQLLNTLQCTPDTPGLPSPIALGIAYRTLRALFLAARTESQTTNPVIATSSGCYEPPCEALLQSLLCSFGNPDEQPLLSYLAHIAGQPDLVRDTPGNSTVGNN